ncbi:uncharacterized protein [Chironomus tepperi]|uniref:uncharacterized protein n=1 Tax=Chironomus tepperi TaxID=113505 RepID=UPI00391F130C
MAVLMSYHKLVERDSKHVDYCWKCTTICLLVLAVVSCFAASLSLQKLVLAYDDHCVLGADIKFSLKPPANLSSSSFAYSESFTSVDIASRLGRFNEEQTYSDEDLKFLNEFQIDDKETTWGKYSTCDFAIYIPIFQLCFGIIITVMFIICGKGGKAEQSSFLPQPWRIVTPSLIFFLAMTCTSIANLTSIHKGMNRFCEGFVNQAPNVGCLVSMNKFVIKDISLIVPSILYIILLTFSWILLTCWIVLLSVMIARVIFVIDFQLVRVTIKTCEQYDPDKTDYQVIEPHEQDKDGKVSEC